MPTTAPSSTRSASSDQVALVAVCAWCGRTIGRAAPASRRLVSHGMCRPCLEEVLASHGRELAAQR
ncbi:MAG TPA: hypothetical protein VIL35_08995 [Vicinamibacterales bacterium]